MLRIPACVAVLFGSSMCLAETATRPTTYDDVIARQARAHGVPESFVHRTVMRESRYNPRAVHHRCYGLMQIKYPTARSMGYQGDPRGLLNPETNLTYAIPYLANAYRLADGNEDRATALFRGGYYYLAKHRGMLDELRTASSPPLTPEPAPLAPESPQSPFAGLFSFLAAPSEAAPPAAAPSESVPPEILQQSPQ
jgi:soluble lytic murein transglycosylase-like protein